MEAIHVERLDHLGLIASVINDLGLVSLIDARLQPGYPLKAGHCYTTMVSGL